MVYIRKSSKQPAKTRKVVYIDTNALQEHPTTEESSFIGWLTAHFDVYIVQTDECVHMLRGDYLISPIRYMPQFQGEWICFLASDKTQIDWERTSEYFHDVVGRGDNMTDKVVDDLTLLSMLRSQLRHEDEQEKLKKVEEKL